MRREGAEQHDKGFQVTRCAAVGVELVHQGHQGGDRGIHLQFENIVADFFDGLMDQRLVGRRNGKIIFHEIQQVPAAIQETL